MQRMIFGGGGLIFLLLGVVTLQARVLDTFSLNKALSLEVYLPSDPCVNALDYTEQLNTDAYHFLLVSNCFHSKSFSRSNVVWRFDHVLPSLVYDGTSGDQGQFFQSWLQKPTGRVENIPDSQFEALSLFQQSDQRKQIEAIHFLCAHTELLAQHPKKEANSGSMRNYYALASTCLRGTSHAHEQRLDMELYDGATGTELIELFSHTTIDVEYFQNFVQ